MIWMHVMAGLLALAAGALALLARKGAPIHRRSGWVFALSMAVMTSSAVLMAVFLRPNVLNVTAGILTFYLVSTGVLAVRRSVADARAWLLGLMLVALTTGGAALALALVGLNSPRGLVDGMPGIPFFLFAAIGLLGGAFDARLLWRGQVQGRQRLARHLGRMGLAMWIATMSFFFGQADEFPAAVRASGVLVVPVLLVTGAIVHGWVRTRWPRSAATGPVRAPAAPAATTAIGR